MLVLTHGRRNLKLVHITKVLLIKLNKSESDFKVVRHMSTNYAFSEIHADPLKLQCKYRLYSESHEKIQGNDFHIVQWDKPGIFWHFFCILLVLCIWRPKICFIKYHTVHIVLHNCNMPVPELRPISILSGASLILQSSQKNNK